MVPLMFVGPPESHDLDRVMEELLMELREVAIGRGVAVTEPNGTRRTVKVVVVAFVCDSRGREKMEQRAGEGRRKPCPSCRGEANLRARDPKNKKLYIGGYNDGVVIFTSEEGHHITREVSPCRVFVGGVPRACSRCRASLNLQFRCRSATRTYC